MAENTILEVHQEKSKGRRVGISQVEKGRAGGMELRRSDDDALGSDYRTLNNRERYILHISLTAPSPKYHSGPRTGKSAF